MATWDELVQRIRKVEAIINTDEALKLSPAERRRLKDELDNLREQMSQHPDRPSNY